MDRVAFYLLDPWHPDGAGKARFFVDWGFRRERAGLLAQALLDHPRTAPHESVEHDAWATRYLFDGPLASPRGPTPPVRTMWQVDGKDGEARLLSAFEY